MPSKTARALQVWEQIDALTSSIVRNINRKHATNIAVSRAKLQAAFKNAQSYMKAAFDNAPQQEFVDAYETYLRELCFNLVKYRVFSCLRMSGTAPGTDLIADLIEDWTIEFVPLMVCNELLGLIIFELVKRRFVSPIHAARVENLRSLCERLAKDPQAALEWIEGLGYPKLP